MKKFLFLLLLSILFPFSSAELLIAPENLSISMVGGDTASGSFLVKNNFPNAASAVLSVMVSCDSNDTAGFAVNLSDASLQFFPGEEKPVFYVIKTMPWISPETYVIKFIVELNTEAFSEEVVVGVEQGSGSSGGSRLFKRLPKPPSEALPDLNNLDINVLISDENVFDENAIDENALPGDFNKYYNNVFPGAENNEKPFWFFIIILIGVVLEILVFLFTLMHFIKKNKKYEEENSLIEK